MQLLRYAAGFVMFALLQSCIEPYDPPLKDRDVDLLVVDAFLNGSDGAATVKLSRTLPVKSGSRPPAETGANVYLEDAQGQIFALTEVTAGSYQGTVSGIASNQQYRLVIRIGDQHEYVSGFTTVMETPPIDSISWSIQPDGIRFEVNTHDPTGQAKFFKWKFTETYEYHTQLTSLYKLTPFGVVKRPEDSLLSYCWRTLESSGIIIGSAKHLDRSLVTDQPVALVPYGSSKLSVEYSLLVRQQALTEETYEFWRNLEKSTENLGGLFDPLPTEVAGDFSCNHHPGEKALGVFSASTVTEQRFTLPRYQLPDNLELRFLDRGYCEIDTVLMADLATIPLNTMLIDEVYGLSPLPIGYTISTRSCADCTFFGGTTIKPVFWD